MHSPPALSPYTTDHQTAEPLCDSPFDASRLPGAMRWAHEFASSVSIIGIRRNREELHIATACTPPSDAADVAGHLATMALQLGMTPWYAAIYTDIGIMLGRMPRLAGVLRDRAHLSFGHLRTMARATLPADDDLLPALEEELLMVILPTRDGEAMRGSKWLHRRIQEIFDRLAPELRPISDDRDRLAEREAAAANAEADQRDRDREQGTTGDPDGTSDGSPDSSFEEYIVVEEGSRATTVTMQLSNTRAHEFFAVLAAIGADQKCSQAETLTHLARGTVDVSVTLNVFKNWDTGQMWLPGTDHWAESVMPADWMDMVDGARLCGDSAVEGYAPSEAQRLFIVGRDGTCRFPGCDRPAHLPGRQLGGNNGNGGMPATIEDDHIDNYDRENPANGGPTDTENLHCLCKGHHDLKTRGMFEVLRLADGTEYWTSTTNGIVAASRPTGPLAGRHRTNFTTREMRKRRTVTAHNQRRVAVRERERNIAEKARHQARGMAAWG